MLILQNKEENGFTFMDVIVGVSLTLIVFLGISGAYHLLVKTSAHSRSRVTALSLARQKLEIISNFSYPAVRYAPEGEIEHAEIDLGNGFTITTTIIPITDSFDGAGEQDNCWPGTLIDYKRIKVEVGWRGGDVALITDVVPETLLQECEESSGVLSVSVLDIDFEPASFSTVEVIDPETETVIAVKDTYSESCDFSLFSGQKYKVRVTAFGYIDQTYGEGDIYTANGQEVIITTPSPGREHPVINVGAPTEIEFQMDELGVIETQTVGLEGEDYFIIPNISFVVQGNKVIGEDSEGKSIYKYSDESISDDLGAAAVSGMEFDNYRFFISSPGYGLIETQPVQPIDLSPGENKQVTLVLADTVLLITVLETLTSEPIFGANVTVSNSNPPPDYDKNRPTTNRGEVIFGLPEAGTYDFTIEALGYEIYEYQASIMEGESKTIIVEMSPA